MPAAELLNSSASDVEAEEEEAAEEAANINLNSTPKVKNLLQDEGIRFYGSGRRRHWHGSRYKKHYLKYKQKGLKTILINF